MRIKDYVVECSFLHWPLWTQFRSRTDVRRSYQLSSSDRPRAYVILLRYLRISVIAAWLCLKSQDSQLEEVSTVTR